MTTSQAECDPFKGVHWFDALDLSPKGLGWNDDPRDGPYDRFPSFIKPDISDVLWWLSTNSAGVHIDFESNAKNIFVRWTLEECEEEEHPYMALAGRSGVDLYGQDYTGQWNWVGHQEAWQAPHCNGRCNRLELDGAWRRYRLSFPTMRRTMALQVGTREEIRSIPKDSRLPIAYYGTSIVHGEGPSRPGMTHVNQLARRLDREILNLGFCGKAYCEDAVAHALGKLNTCLYIIDVLPNNGPNEVRGRLTRFLNILHSAKPNIPKLLIGDRVFGDATFMPSRFDTFRQKNYNLDLACQDLKASGIKNLHLVHHSNWFGDHQDGTSDGSHPNDLGATEMARSLEPIVRHVLAQ